MKATMCTVETAMLVNGKISTFTIECEVGNGIGIHLVGMNDIATKECLLRVCTALQLDGFSIPGHKITIRIKSDVAQLSSNASQFDLPIALALLSASYQIKGSNLYKSYIIGELGLDGNVRTCRDGAILASLLLEKDSDRAIILPAGSAMEAWNQFGRNIYAVENLFEAIEVVEKMSLKYLLWNSKRFTDALNEVLKMRNESKKSQLTSAEE